MLRQTSGPSEAVRPTTIIQAPSLAKRLRVRLTIASETFQHTGSFKFRPAYYLVSGITERQIIATSSGNFGQAIAFACQLLNKSCVIVMPSTAPKAKVDAVREYGGLVDMPDLRGKSRAKRLEELAIEYPHAYFGTATDDPFAIEGNASLGIELGMLDKDLDCIVVPIGSGGLAAGIITGIARTGRTIEVIGAEPSMANDAARSLRSGRLLANRCEPQTIADGARALRLSSVSWTRLRDGLTKIIEVPEEKIMEAMRLLFLLANVKAEPTGALAIGALLTKPSLFRNKSVCCVVSGGNADPELFRRIL